MTKSYRDASYCHETKVQSPSSQNLVAAPFPKSITKEYPKPINKTLYMGDAY